MKKFSLKIPALSVRARLMVMMGALGALLVVGAAVGLGFMAHQNDATRLVYEDGLLPTQVVGDIRQKSLQSFVVLSEAATMLTKSDQLQQKMSEFAQYQKELVELEKKLVAIPMSPQAVAAMKDWQSTKQDYASAENDVTDSIKQKDSGVSDLLSMELRPLVMQRQSALAKFAQVQSKDAAIIYQSQVASFKLMRMLIAIALTIALIGVLLWALLTIRSITVGLDHATRIAGEIAAGRLGHQIPVTRNDELGRLLEAFRAMDQRLVAIVSDVRAGSDEVSTAAQQIARGNDDLSQRTQEQASSLEETASSMEEMTSTVKQNAENASHADQLARGAREQAERGGEVAAMAMTAMREIDVSSRKISDIVSLIDEIAFQTNLLALNAAVEAARAGEQGRGFAVVATEVRNLAQRSAGAAKEIKLLISDSAGKVKRGSELVDQSGKALADIVDSVKKVTDIVAEIAAAGHEQSAGIDQVNNAVSQMDEMTQQNAALVEEASAAAHAMHEQAGELTRHVGFFTLEGRSPSPVRSPAPAASPVLHPASALKQKPKVEDTVAMIEADAVFAATRKTPASPKPASPRVKEAADSSVWKEF